jgi:hypothetical protein
MNAIKESLNIARSLLPRAKRSRSGRNKFFHFAFGYHNNNLLAIGQNMPDKTHTRAMKIAERFQTQINYPYLHAETDLISRLWNKYHIDENLKVVIIRLNKNAQLRNSKPCEKCSKIMKCLGITQIYWSTNDGIVSKS